MWSCIIIQPVATGAQKHPHKEKEWRRRVRLLEIFKFVVALYGLEEVWVQLNKHVDRIGHTHPGENLNVFLETLFKAPYYWLFSQQTFLLVTAWQWASMHNTKTLKVKQLNGIQPSFISSFSPVLFLLCQNVHLAAAKQGPGIVHYC